jgi:hypothetical protein
MNLEEPRNLVRKTFESDFDPYNFKNFIGSLLKDVNFNKTFQQSGSNIRRAFQDKVSSFERIGQFTDPNAKTADILVVNLKKETTLERGRTSLRNFAADYLQSDRGVGKSAVLAAYVSNNKKDWRFSFVTLERERELNEEGNFVLAIKKLTPARRYSFLVGQNENSHTAQKQFVDLLKSKSAPTLEPIEEAFKIEKVTKEFFEQYKGLYAKTRSELETIFNQNEKVQTEFISKKINLDDFAKKLLGQIVFLYFLQKKGWFGVSRESTWGDGDKKFLRNLFDNKHSNKNFFNDYLEPLFYEVLAKERDFDYYKEFDCKIPFLNGGLFEPIDGYDWVHTDIFLPDELFHNTGSTREGDVGTGILDVFDRYNFTVNEAEPLETEVAVDPEMLGKVFENLLPENERQGKGTYYTPRAIVGYMCQQALVNYLSTSLPKIDKEDIEHFILHGSMSAEYQADQTKEHQDKWLKPSIIENAKEIDKLLADVKVCDPAIGSGAFPVGILQEIVKARETLISTGEVSTKSSYELKRHTIENSIYGIDIDSGAVEIAKLRLWLSLIVDEEDRTRVEPLPNLDYKIMQGNSLLEEFRGISLVSDRLLEKPKDDSSTLIAELKRKIGEKSQEFFALYQQGNSGLIKRQAVEKDVENLKKQLDSLTKSGEKDKQNSPLLESAENTQIPNRLNELEKLHDHFKNETRTNEKRSLRERINSLEHGIIREHLDGIEDNLRNGVFKLKTELEEETEYLQDVLKKNDETPKIKRLRREIEAKHKELNNVEIAQKELAEMNFAKAKPFFLWKLQFSEIFRDKGGFDIVIANPPYIQLQKSSGELSKQYERCGFETFEKTGDIYSLFYETGFKVLKEKGALIYITSNKWMRTAYGAKTRKFFVEKTNPLLLIDFAGQKIFETATVDTNILLFSKENNQGNTLACIIKDKVLNNLSVFVRHNSTECEFSGSDSWVVLSPIEKQIKEKIDQIGVYLKDWNISINYGIKTGFNDAFIITGEKRNELIADDPKSAEIIRPILRGRNIKKYYAKFDDNWIINSHNGVRKNDIERINVEKDYPVIFKHLEGYQNELEIRLDKGSHWTNLRNCAYLEDFDKEKIIWMELTDRPNFYLDNDGYYINNTIFFMSGDRLRYILSFLNSKLCEWYFTRLAVTSGAGTRRWFKIYVEQIPVPQEIDSQIENRLIDLVAEIQNLKKKQFDTSSIEQEIDQEIFKLFDFTSEEVNFILSSLV